MKVEVVNSTTIFIPQVFTSELTKAQLEKLAVMAVEKFPQIAEGPVFIYYQEERIKIFLSDLSERFNELPLEKLPRITEKAPFEELEPCEYWEDTYAENDEFCFSVTFIPKKSWVIAQLEAALEAK